MAPQLDAIAGRRRLLLVAFTLLAYGVAFGGPFQFDDRGVIVDAEAVHSWTGLLADLAHGLRPILKLSYALCWAIGGGASWPFHGFNLLVHLANVELVFRLAHHAKVPSAAWPIAFTFALHPIQTEAITYVSGRSSSLSTLFVLLALLAHARRAQATKPAALTAASAFAFVCAVLTKETTLVLPLGLLLWDLSVARASPRSLLRAHAPLWGLGFGVFLFVLWHPRYYALLYDVVGQRSLIDSLAYQCGGLRYLAGRLLLLERPCIDPGLWLAPSRAGVLVGAALVLTFTTLAMWQRRARPWVSFGLVWFLLFAWLPYVLLPRVDVINERHAYVANVGLFLAVGGVLYERAVRWAAKPRTTAAVLSVAVMLVCTLRRNLEYRSEVVLWQSTTREAPHNPRAFHNLGVAYEHEHKRLQAMAAYVHALTLEPRYVAARRRLEFLTAHRP